MAGSTELAVLGIQFATEGGDETLAQINKLDTASRKFVTTLQVQVDTFGHSKEAMLAYAAATMGITQETNKQIALLTELTVAQEQARITQTRDLELYKLRGEAIKQLSATEQDAYKARAVLYAADWAAAEADFASRVALDAQRIRSIDENSEAQNFAALTEVEANRVALEKQQMNVTIFAAFKARTLKENQAVVDAALDAETAANQLALEKQQTAQTIFSAFKTRILKENQAAVELAAINEAEAAKAAYEKQQADMIVFAAFKSRTLRENLAEANVILDAEIAAQQAAMDAQTANQTIFNAFKMRTLKENEDARLAQIAEADAQAAAYAEQQAIAEIKWASLSYETRIKQLRDLQSYQASESISGNTTSKAFANVPTSVSTNAAASEEQYALALAKVNAELALAKKASKDAATEAEGLAFNTSRVTSELVVEGREFSRGNYSKMAGSFTVLADAAGGLLNPLVWLGSALAVVSFEMTKGALEQEKLKDALIITNNYAGTSVSGLNQLAYAATTAGGTISNAKEAVLSLAGSGKFTADEIGKISTAATEMQMATGQAVTATVAQFESLAVQSTGRSAQASEAVIKAAIKLDDQFHYLTTAIYENAEALGREGDAKGASQVVMEAYAEAIDKRSKEIIANAGNILTAWNSVKVFFSGLGDDIANWGSKDPAIKLQALNKEISELQSKIATNVQQSTSNISGSGDTVQTIELRSRLAAAIDKQTEAQRNLDEQTALGSIDGLRTIETSASVHSSMERDLLDITLKNKGLSELKIAQNQYLEEQKNWAKDAANTGIANPRLDPAAIAAENELILKKYTAKPPTVAQNPLDQAIVEMVKKIAGYKAIAEAAQQTGLTEVQQMSRTNEMQVIEEIAQGKYQELKKGWSSDDQKAKEQRLIDAAKDADAAKYLETQANSMSALQIANVKRIAENKAAIDDLNGSQLKSVDAETAKQQAYMQTIGVVKDSAEWVRVTEQAAQIDKGNTTKAIETKMVAEIKANKIAAEESIAAASNLINYGGAAKATAVQIAQIQIEQSKANDSISDSVRANLLASAGYRDVATASENLQKIYQKELAAQQERDAVGKASFIGAETAKVMFAQEAAMKIVAIQLAQADNGMKAAKQGSVEEQASAQAAYDSAIAAYQQMATLTAGTNEAALAAAGLIDAGTALKDMGTSAQSLGVHFANIATGLTGMGSALTNLGKIQDNFNKTGATDIQGQLKGYADLTDGIANMFDKKSKGYAVAHGISQAFHVVEMAMAAEQTIAGVIEGAATMFGQSGWGGFAGVAAMGLVMAGLGYSAMGGSSTPDAASSGQMQASQGTGTVFGGAVNTNGVATTQSNSIQNSLQLMGNNSSTMVPLTMSMLSALNGISSAMTGLANLVTQATGVTSASNMSISGLGKTTAFGGSSGLMGAIGGFLGGSSTSSVTDAGLQYGGTVGSLAQGQGVNQYANVNTTTKGAFGGLFGGNSSSDQVQTTAVSQTISSQFGLIFSSLQATLTSAASALGQSSSAVASQVQNFVLPLTNISLKGLTGTALTNAINAVISASLDKISGQVFPQVQAFQQIGEGMAQTVIRVATGVANANSALTGLGLNAIAYTSIINKQGDVQTEIERQTMVATQQLGGGVLTGIGNIIQQFTGDATTLTTLWAALIKAQTTMQSVGLNGNNLSQSTITGAGSQANLTQGLSDYLKNYFTPAQQSAIELTGLNAQFTALGVKMPATNAGFAQLVMSVDTSTAAGQKLQGGLLNLSGAFATATTNAQGLSGVVTVATATTNLTTAYNTQYTAINNVISSLSGYATGLQTFKDGLATSTLSTLTPQQKYQAASDLYNSTLASANRGDATAQGQLQTVTSAFLTASQTANASSAAYQADYAKVQKDLASAITGAQTTQLTTAQQQLAALNQQVSGLITINQSVQTVAQAVAAMPQLIQVLVNAMNNAVSGSGTAALNGSHAAGLAFVPFNGYRAELHQGEQVLTADQAVDYKTMGRPDMTPLVNEIKSLRAEVANLRADQNSQTGALIASTYDSTKKAAIISSQATVSASKSAAWINKVQKAVKR